MTPGIGTIAAIATPTGRGGLGLVRISGPGAGRVARAVFRGPGRNGGAPPHARARFGLALGPGGEPLDRGYLTFFRAPRSYTGEDTAEISVHGSPLLLERLLEAALGAGARPAGPGEFTWRAFRNGRVDLAQAEAVADLVEARTLEGARLAFRQSEGALSRRLVKPRAALIDLMARLEASLEFGEEEGTVIDAAQIATRIAGVRTPLRDLAGSYRRGRVLRRGATAVLAGLPNVGKSSLFNRLAGEARAIVHPEPGTTRDLVAETIDLEGVPLRLVDTAGLGAAADPVEAEGVRRADEARREAELLLLVLDRSRPLREEERRLLRALPPDAVVVRNKADLPPAAGGEIPGAGARAVVETSARTGTGVEALRTAMARRLGATGEPGAPLTRRRHQREILAALESLERAATASASGAGEELILADLAGARDALGRLTGEIALDDLYDRVFSTFCIGK